MRCNQFYDGAAGNSGGQLYGVQEAATKMEQTKALDNIDVSAELPVSIIREQTPAASLRYHLNQAQLNNAKAACISINDKTVAFNPTQDGITVLDSHYHGTSGAFVAMAPSDAAFELLVWFKMIINSIPHNLVTVTCVSFR